ncbi:MAG: hypothetical protein HKN82_05785 [Akkermansiaceae bacterium]|nr:hypothetical protein [Akkermansiaceae bacterium]
MSILASLIGVLTLLISVNMIIKEKERDDLTQEEFDRAKLNQTLKTRIAKLEKDLQKLEEQVKKEKTTTVELMKLKEREIALRKKLEEIAKAKDPKQTDAELQKILENLEIETKALVSGQPPLTKRRDELLAELKRMQTPPKDAERVVIRPGGVGSRTARNIFFVECNSTGIVIRQEDAEPVPVPTGAITKNDAYGDFLEKVKKTRDSMVLFLVRKAGNTAYLWAAGHAETQFEVNTGKLPVPKDGEIDLSLFDL